MIDFFGYKNNFSKYEDILSRKVFGLSDGAVPLVSIVIPTYNRASTLKNAIDSAINQKKFDDYAIIIVDNEVEENTETEKLVRSYANKKLYYYKNQKNIGMTGNWNRGIELARGEWLTILHDDDKLLPDFLHSMVSVIKKNTKIEMLIPKVVTCNDQNINIINPATYGLGKEIRRIKNIQYLLGNLSPAPGILIKKINAINLGGFNDEDYPCADYTFWMRYNLKYGGYLYNRKLALYRLDSLNTTKSAYKCIIEKSYEIKMSYIKILSETYNEKIFFLNNGMINIIKAYKNYMLKDEFGKTIAKYGLDNGVLNRVKYYIYRIIYEFR